MANIKSAEKRNRLSEGQRLRNRGYRTRMRSSIRELRSAVASGDRQRAEELLPETLRLVDVTARKKVIHANAAARTKSRLTHAVAGMTRD